MGTRRVLVDCSFPDDMNPEMNQTPTRTRLKQQHHHQYLLRDAHHITTPTQRAETSLSYIHHKCSSLRTRIPMGGSQCTIEMVTT